MRTLRFGAAVAFVTVAFLSGAPASAHHSRAGYDQAKDKLTTLNGVIAEVIWRNPHVYVTWDSKDEKGTVVRWTGELSSTATMLSEGLSRDTFKPGDPLTITFMPTKAGTPQGLVIRVVRPDGKVVIDLSERRGLLEQ
jgi:hypothetical protein